MTLKENFTRLIDALHENSDYEFDELQELIQDAPADDIKSSPRQFVQLCKKLTENLIQNKQSVAGINLILAAICKLQNHPTQLTPLHSSLCLLCLDSKCLNPAIKLLDIDYTDIKKLEEKSEDWKHVMLYYYYGGMIYTAVKNFERASAFFEVVLTIPSNIMDPIMQEAYKKQIVLSLLIHGKVPDNLLPKYTSPCVMKYRKQLNNPYHKLANEFTSLNYEKIKRVVNCHSPAFRADENMGLIKQCLTQVHKKNIQRLTKTFVTLALKDVADHVGLASEKEAETYILNMIDDGEIFATINQKDGMVVFQDNPENYESLAVFQKIQEDTTTSIMLIETLKKLDVDHSNSSTAKTHATKDAAS